MRILFDRVGNSIPTYDIPAGRASVLGPASSAPAAVTDGPVEVPTYPATTELLRQIISLLAELEDDNLAVVVSRCDGPTSMERERFGLLIVDEGAEATPKNVSETMRRLSRIRFDDIDEVRKRAEQAAEAAADVFRLAEKLADGAPLTPMRDGVEGVAWETNAGDIPLSEIRPRKYEVSDANTPPHTVARGRCPECGNELYVREGSDWKACRCGRFVAAGTAHKEPTPETAGNTEDEEPKRRWKSMAEARIAHVRKAREKAEKAGIDIVGKEDFDIMRGLSFMLPADRPDAALKGLVDCSTGKFTACRIEDWLDASLDRLCEAKAFDDCMPPPHTTLFVCRDAAEKTRLFELAAGKRAPKNGLGHRKSPEFFEDGKGRRHFFKTAEQVRDGAMRESPIDWVVWGDGAGLCYVERDEILGMLRDWTCEMTEPAFPAGEPVGMPDEGSEVG